MKLAVFALLLVVLPFQASSYVCDTLYVNVKEGLNIPDDGIFNLGDPYVKVTVDGKSKYTRVVDGSRSPGFYEEFKFTNVKSDKLVLEMWDEDGGLQGGDDHLATCKEKIKPGSEAKLCYTNEPAFWYQIHCLKGNMKKKENVTVFF